MALPDRKFSRHMAAARVAGHSHGFHTLSVATFEESGNSSVDQYEKILVDICYADLSKGGRLDLFDFLCFQNAFVAGCP